MRAQDFFFVMGPAILFARLLLFGVRFISLLLAMVEQLLRGFSDLAVRCLGGALRYITSACILKLRTAESR